MMPENEESRGNLLWQGVPDNTMRILFLEPCFGTDPNGTDLYVSGIGRRIMIDRPDAVRVDCEQQTSRTKRRLGFRKRPALGIESQGCNLEPDTAFAGKAGFQAGTGN
jgi:hypothetical protein